MTNKAKEAWLDGLRAGLKPPTTLKPWQWAAKNVKISNSERASFFDPEQTPWWKAPMECAGDHEVREVVVIAPTGSGKSTMAEGLIPYIIAEDPGAMFYASQTDADARFWAETRLKPALMSVEQVRRLFPEDRHKSRKLEIIFPHMPLIMGGANMSNFQEKSVRWIYGDEVWKWEAGLLRECQARTHNRWNRKEFYVSQAGVGGQIEDNGVFHGGDDLWREWMKTDRASFSWKCECGQQHPFGFGSIKYDIIEKNKGVIDEQATAKTARMACSECGKEYEDNTMVRRKLSESNMDNGKLGYISLSDTAFDSIRGFHVDSLAIWWIPWWQEVLEFLGAKRLSSNGFTDALRQWTQKRRAQFWTDDMADSEVRITRSSDFEKKDFEGGQLIDEEMARFATIDVGKDHYWIVIAAWRNGGFCKVLYEGYIPSDGGNEKELVDLCDRYAVARAKTLIDIGYQQDRIADLCVEHGWIGIKGEGNKRHFLHPTATGKPVEKLYSTTKRVNSRSGGIMKYIFAASNPIKDILSAMVGNGDQIELPKDLSKPFENHMQCERRNVVRNPKTGEEKSEWIRPGGQANHLWDCMCYQVVAALICKVFED
jgi:phage terminase large subunit GpA-like protein